MTLSNIESRFLTLASSVCLWFAPLKSKVCHLLLWICLSLTFPLLWSFWSIESDWECFSQHQISSTFRSSGITTFYIWFKDDSWFRCLWWEFHINFQFSSGQEDPRRDVFSLKLWWFNLNSASTMDECEDGAEEELMDGLRKEHFRWVEARSSSIRSFNNFVMHIPTKLDEFSEIFWTAYQRLVIQHKNCRPQDLDHHNYDE